MTVTQQRFAMQPAQTRESAAPQIGQAAPWQPSIRPAARPAGGAVGDVGTRRRTPLALVPTPIRKSGRGFAALCIAVLVAALMAVLITNITVSNRQYELVSLKNEQLDLSQSNEVLRQQVEHLEAPQNLSAEARRLGMVNPGDIASIDLATGAVTGTATAADAEDQPGGHVASPVSPEEKQAAAQAADPEAADTAQPEGAAAPAATPEGGTEGGPEETTGVPEQDLNGGTIPAPQFSARGN
ncbi:hypothetical protein AB0K08_09375 [Citricoccus sp. NPDC055426]|uniref:hypothetical protein n=1 Tax=Citricoccus sp. NPDC055426 TaxID=3155536 RepID=UPI0034299747